MKTLLTLLLVTFLVTQASGNKLSDSADHNRSEMPLKNEKLEDLFRKISATPLLSNSQNLVMGQQQPRQGGTARGQGQGGNRLFNRFDTNGDNQITENEFTGPPERFTQLDANGDGVISEDEASNAQPPQGQRGNRSGGQVQETISSASLPSVTAGSASKPNFVFIFADDMGWTGTSVEMIPGDPRTKSDYYRTPYLEILAAQGMRFSAAYAPAAMCTPSRAAVITGKTPAEIHITTPGPGTSTNAHKMRSPTQLREFPEYETTIAEALKTAGYASAYFGKWHLGQGNPGQHGFDVHDGTTSNETPASEPPENPKDVFGLNERAMDFMRTNVKAGRPFYVQLFHYSVHSPVATLGKSKRMFEKLPAGERHHNPEFAGMTWDLDQSIGTLMDEIDELDIADNTYVIFLSDNGGMAGQINTLNNAPLALGKSTLYEGGIRVPLIVTGPGIPKNSYSSESVTGCDLFPTFCEWAGIPVPSKVDGSSLAGILSGKTEKLDRHVSSLLFHSPHYGRSAAARPTTAIIADNYKLIKDWEKNSYKLFNLAEDLGEQNDLAASVPSKLNQLIAMMDDRLTSVNAQLPIVNPDYDPNAPLPERRRPGGGPGRQRSAN